MQGLAAFFFLLFITSTSSSAGAFHVTDHPKRTTGGIHLPIYRRQHDGERQDLLTKRDGNSASAIGLGNFRDITYNVIVDMGGVDMPLVLDTGSSDLWAISDACTDPTCQNDLPRYPQSHFNSSGVDARLFYGDSITGTHAFGEVGKDKVSLAGLVIEDQLFASINQTNTTVVATQSAGIFGLGFPVNSVIWAEAFRAQFPRDGAPRKRDTNLRMTKFPDLKGLLGGGSRKRMLHAMQARDANANPPLSAADNRRTPFPDLKSLLPSSSSNSKRQSTSNPTLPDLLGTFTTNGPLMSRLAQSSLASPQFTVTLQRSTIDVDSGNQGLLSLGELPQGVDNSSLAWVPVRGYTAAQGGIDSPTDVYPIAWEVPIDGVFLDGTRLADSTLSPGISVTALIDTGNSLLRGPKDVVANILSQVTGSSVLSTYDCTVPHTLAFQIGGKMFPVDPRDFFNPTTSHGETCSPNVVATDPPKEGFLYSWSLGDPFLKSVLSSFYFGNLTHPSVDPPRMGFFSTVPADAAQHLQSAVANVQSSSEGIYPTQVVSSPPASPSALHQVSPPTTFNSFNPNASNSSTPSNGDAAAGGAGAGGVTQTVSGVPVQGTLSGGKGNGGVSLVRVRVPSWGAVVWVVWVACMGLGGGILLW